MKLRLAIDVDGCLADFVWGITKRISLLDPSVKPFPTPEQQSWDFRQLPAGLFERAFREAGQDAYNFNANLDSLLTDEEAKRLLQLSLDHECYYATNRPGGVEAIRGTRDFLVNKLGLVNPNVVLTRWKGEFAAAIDATHVIDDKAGNVSFVQYHLKRISPSTKVYLLDRPYNRFDQTVLATKAIRIYSFTEFLDQVEADAKA